jgi:hypothetical protein
LVTGRSVTFSTLHDVVLQNGISDPDQIVVDQVLRYDSKKTSLGRHSNKISEAMLKPGTPQD